MQNNALQIGDLIAYITLPAEYLQNDIFLVLDITDSGKEFYTTQQPWFKIVLWRFAEAKMATFHIPESELHNFFIPRDKEYGLYILLCRPNA